MKIMSKDTIYVDLTCWVNKCLIYLISFNNEKNFISE